MHIYVCVCVCLLETSDFRNFFTECSEYLVLFLNVLKFLAQSDFRQELNVLQILQTTRMDVY